MGVSSSVATTLNTPLLSGGPASVVWMWFIGSIFCLALGTSIAELISVRPSPSLYCPQSPTDTVYTSGLPHERRSLLCVRLPRPPKVQGDRRMDRRMAQPLGSSRWSRLDRVWTLRNDPQCRHDRHGRSLRRYCTPDRRTLPWTPRRPRSPQRGSRFLLIVIPDSDDYI